MTTRTLMRVEAVSEYIGQPASWVRTAMADGTIPGARKVKHRWMVTQADLDAWIDAGQPERTPADGPRYQPFPRVMTRTRRDAAA